MSLKIVECELPKILYENSINIAKCIENNIPIKRTIRKEIYKWLIKECIQYSKQKRCVFMCPILKAMFFSFISPRFNNPIHEFNLNDKNQHILPELNINKIRYYNRKNKTKLHATCSNGAWFDGHNYDIRIDILNHCINTINKNIELERRVTSSTGEQH